MLHTVLSGVFEPFMLLTKYLIPSTAKTIWEMSLTTEVFYNQLCLWGMQGETLTFMQFRFMAVSVWLAIS